MVKKLATFKSSSEPPKNFKSVRTDIPIAPQFSYVLDTSWILKLLLIICLEGDLLLNSAITPGLDFDQKRGANTIRFSYARSTEDIIEGAKRIKKFMSSYN